MSNHDTDGDTTAAREVVGWRAELPGAELARRIEDAVALCVCEPIMLGMPGE